MLKIKTPKGIREFQRDLLCWHRSNRRDYPWRKTRDPYKILVAEFLLQQTDAPKVIPVYEQFVSEFPTVDTLAKANIEDVVAVLAPLGLRYRSQRLIAAANHIMTEHGGNVPTSEEELLRLPGVGRYIARAVLAVAFGEKRGVLDTNVIRVLERCFNIRTSRHRAREDKALWDLVDRLVPPKTMSEPAEWNWAMLDFGAAICSCFQQNCTKCPILQRCCQSLRKA